MLAAAVACLWSCLKEENPEVGDPYERTFYAVSADGAPQARAVVAPDGSVQWTPGETIRVFYTEYTGYHVFDDFSNCESQNSSSAVFRGKAQNMDLDSPVIAVSPSMYASVDFETSEVGYVIPWEQTAVEGSFDPAALVAFARAKGDKLNFYNAVGGVRFTVSEPGIDKVEFEAIGEHYLTGYMYATLDGNGVPTDIKPARQSNKAKSSKRLVTLSAPEGTTFKTGVWYYMAVTPVDLPEGGNLYFYKGYQRAKTEIVKPLSVKRAVIGSLTKPDSGLSYASFSPDNVIYYRTTDEQPITIDSMFTNGYPEGNPIISNTYEAGWGAITFESPVYRLFWLFSGKTTLKEVVFPDRITKMDRTLNGCTSLERVVLPRSLEEVDSGFLPKDRKIDVSMRDGMKMVPKYLFNNCTWLQTVYLPKSIEVIGERAFFGTSLMILNLPDNVREIGRSAFYDIDIQSVDIPPSVEVIGDYAFYNGHLVNVTGGAGLKEIGEYAFGSNYSLKKISLDAATPPSATKRVVSYPFLTVLSVPEKSISTYKSTPIWEEFYVCNGSPYQSTSFSRDGEVKTIQTASKGNGIDIVFMGDAYTDRLVNDGTYDRDMRKAANAFFDVEPYKSFKNLFNVYYVVAVSKDEIYSSSGDGYARGNTALGVYFQLNDTYTTGPDDVCRKYVTKVLPTTERIWSSMAVIVVNTKANKGTCFNYVWYKSDDWDPFDFTRAYCAGRNDEELAQTIRHEAGGHGFGKLDDEYTNRFDLYTGGSLADSYAIGHRKNVSATSNPSLVPWAKYLNDSRYAAEELGVYEGGGGYARGMYRPSENSIMRDNKGFFNAPSREAIYYRMHKLAYGSSWTYNHETFVSYDRKNIKKHEPFVE